MTRKVITSRITGVALCALLLAAGGAGAPAAGGAVAVRIPTYVGPTPLSTGDFNGDGRDELAVGVPSEDNFAGKVDAGTVAVLYGSSSGLRAEQNQNWNQARPGVPGVLEQHDGFGWATAAGDFDGDGYDDLAIGVPLETLVFDHNGVVIYGRSPLIDARLQAGTVNVLYGSPSGLTAARAEIWHQGKSGIKGKPEHNDFFGASLAAGDFNGDGRDELAVGVPGENKGAGAVQILAGSRTGLTAKGDQLWLQGQGNLDDVSEAGDAFGSALAAGNLGFSSREEDLAIGVPGEKIGAAAAAGAVQVLYGQPTKGLSATLVPDVFLHQNRGGVDDQAEAGDIFGAALAIGDFGRSADGDLAVGVPGESAAVARQGAVQVFYGSVYGVNLNLADAQLWRKGAGALKGVPEAGEELGRSLAAADFNGFSQADLAVGAPLADPGGVHDAGAVHVVYGSPAGLTVSGSVAVPDQVWTRAALPQETYYAIPVGSDRFGYALAAGRFGRSPSGADLAASAPDAAGSAGGGMTCCPASGLVHVLAGGAPSGLSTADHRVWHQNMPGIFDQSEAGDRFGGG